MSKVSNWFTRGRVPHAPFASQPTRFRFYVYMLEYYRRFRALLYVYNFELVAGFVIATIIALATLCSGCVTEVVKEEVEPFDLIGIAEAFCDANPAWPCGHVYECGEVEMCALDSTPLEEVEAVHGTCVPTTRHEGLCWHCCGEGCTVGCNAYDGCFCPAPPPPPPPPPTCDPHPVPPTL